MFECINNYSANSELRYVGGCVRKILNKEEVEFIRNEIEVINDKELEKSIVNLGASIKIRKNNEKI